MGGFFCFGKMRDVEIYGNDKNVLKRIYEIKHSWIHKSKIFYFL